MPGARNRLSTRALMIVTAVVGVDTAVIIQAARVGATVEFTLFISAAIITLNFFFVSYLKAADRMNAAPPEKQTEMLLSLGCLLMVMMALFVPVVIVILVRAQG